VTEWRLFPAGTVPEWTTAEWYAGRDTAPHIDQPAHRGRLELARDFALDATTTYGCESVVDLGCGDGGLLSLIAERNTDAVLWGYDLQQSNVDAAHSTRGVADVFYGDVVNDPDSVEWADCAIATEMLEHLLDPHGFVQRVAENSRVVVASSPYTESDQAHYEFHTWAWDLDGYRALISHAGFQVVRHQTVDMFQVVMGVRP
jgi:2-polyprenyl-3-methyl-5-hydroxy-6-metoxy-1,4-benzoquinol methylase